MSTRKVFCVILSLSVFLGLCHVATAKSVPTDAAQSRQQAQEEDKFKEWNNQIRREKFDLVLPQVMRERNIDMWIHVMRIAIPDPFGAEDLGSTSGVFVFTDRGGDRIERAVLGRRWGASHRERGEAPFISVGSRTTRQPFPYSLFMPTVTISFFPSSFKSTKA